VSARAALDHGGGAPHQAGIMTKRIVSGIQPTGSLHLGNYLGAIRNWVALQEEAECVFFLADLHALTMWNEPDALRASVRDIAAALIASGVDPERSTLFRQSDVRAHAELAWLLGCTARVGWLNRMTQFKDKSGKDREGASAGLYFYPVLQAADILAYKATHVPVGEDQKQHLELARDIAIKFNTDYGVELFIPPEPYIGKTAARVMSLRDGRSKMSKSDPSDQSRINLTDDADTIAGKVKRAKTDPDLLPGDPAALAGRPEAANLVGIYAALAGETEVEVLSRFEGKGFGAFKPALAELMVAKLAPMNERYRTLREDRTYLDRILEQGAARASALTSPTIAEAYRAVGLR
jgi:tryptophanyl-tRNA synthetase